MKFIFQFLFPLMICCPTFGQQTVGLFLNDSLASDGFTLLGNNNSTYLIDQCGFVVNTWESDFSIGASMYLLENGNLLRTAELDGEFNAGGVGGRFELFDWNGNLLWNYDYINQNLQGHHDIEPLPNGNFLAIVWEKIAENEAIENGRKYDGEIWSEKIIELEIVGNQEVNIVWEWRLWDHLIQDFDANKSNFGNVADHPELVDINYIGEDENTSGDWIHLNAISYHSDLDQIAISSRNFSEIWIIDHSTTTAEAKTSFGGNSNKGGSLLYRYGNPQTYQRGTSDDQIFSKQHDVRWVPEGLPFENHLMVFNNEKTEMMSSIDIWNPPLNSDGSYDLNLGESFGPTNLTWEYTASDFHSKNMSGAHFLPNGNLFITEGRSGRLFEITPDEEKVWEYINPVNSNGSATIQGGTVHFNSLFRATKYPSDFSAFLDKDMTSGNPIELNPWENDCDTSHILIPSVIGLGIKILGNPVFENLIFQANFSNKKIHFKLFDILGKTWLEKTVNEGVNEIDISTLPKGIYVIQFFGKNKTYDSFKILKK